MKIKKNNKKRIFKNKLLKGFFFLFFFCGGWNRTCRSSSNSEFPCPCLYSAVFHGSREYEKTRLETSSSLILLWGRERDTGAPRLLVSEPTGS